MTLAEYIDQLKGVLVKLEAKQEFEICADIRELINAMETGNICKYIELQFDKKELIKCGFFKKGWTCVEMEDRIKTFFGYESVFEFSVREDMWCPYVRYLNGTFDMIKEVKF